MAHRGSRLAVLLVLVLAATALAEDSERKVAITDPEKAGPEFKIQGEYLGEVDFVTYGAQVIAFGNGRFRVVAYLRGLPGAGADTSMQRSANGETKDGVTKFVSSDGEITLTLKAGALEVSDIYQVTRGVLKRTERVSPTLGAKPPEGAVVLFDGKNANQFDSGKMSDTGLLEAGAVSKPKFKDSTLHIEFRTPFMPESRGQARGNSGVYLQGRYEIQVLDSLGMKDRDDECGAIYKVAAPKVNMCLPPLSWQTYDVDFTAAKFDASGKKTANAKVTVKHNGVPIHENLELANVTPGGVLDSESPAPGPLFLQEHGKDPVMYRNIWVVEKK